MIGPVRHYARWQLRDHVMGAGRVIGLAAVVVGLLLWRFAAERPEAGQGAGAALTGFLGSLGWPLVVLATAGMVSTDRVDGYNRALFSAPISPVAYYFQRWLLGALVVGLLPLAMVVAVWLALDTWIEPAPFTGAMLLTYLLLGSLVFCWSTFGRRDWAIGLTVYLGERTVHDAVASGMPVPTVLQEVNRWMPPFHLVDFGEPMQPGVQFPAGIEWWHYTGYAVALLVAAGLVLRFRPMGSGVRG